MNNLLSILNMPPMELNKLKFDGLNINLDNHSYLVLEKNKERKILMGDGKDGMYKYYFEITIPKYGKHYPHTQSMQFWSNTKKELFDKLKIVLFDILTGVYVNKF